MRVRPISLLVLVSVALSAAPAWAAAEGADLTAALLASLAVIAAAAALHWGLRRLGRRLPRLLARRSVPPGQSPNGFHAAWQRTVDLTLVIPKVAVWLGVAYYVTDRFAILRNARVMLDHVVVMSLTSPLFTLNQKGYSALDVLELPAVLAALWIGASLLAHLLKSQVLRSTGVERGVQETVALLTRYTLVFLGGIVILQVWGIDMGSLTIVASVLGVGIGFGLQHLANNFVSGLVVSLERPIQPGDFVNVGALAGTVERIGPRSTEIRTLDRVSILIPNSRFLESEVVNWSHGDPVSRIHVPVSVAYGSDVARVRAALLEAARSHPEVLADPRPRVEFRAFGESALNFELLVWTRDPRAQFQLTSDLNYRIEANLRRHRIQIPFPQRDLHLHAPQLERVVTAWSRRTFSEAELAAPNGDGAMPEASAGWSDIEEDPSTRAWTDTDLEALAARMRGSDGISITDRRHLLTVYPQCFVGREAVDWLTRTEGLTREEAVAVGKLLMDRGLVRHVLDEHPFEDGNFFYRFQADEQPEMRAG